MRESGASIQRRRRRRRAAITLTLIAVLLLGTFTYAAAYFQGWVGSSVPTPLASPTCQTVSPVKVLAPKSVVLNVYNATSRQGLAATVAKSLQTQGFKVLRIDNDPIGRTIRGVGEIRHGPQGAAAAALAATRLSGARMILDRRTDASVDVVLGNTFTALSTPRKVAALAPAPAPAPAKGTTVRPVKGALNVAKPTPSPTRSC